MLATNIKSVIWVAWKSVMSFLFSYLFLICLSERLPRVLILTDLVLRGHCAILLMQQVRRPVIYYSLILCSCSLHFYSPHFQPLCNMKNKSTSSLCMSLHSCLHPSPITTWCHFPQSYLTILRPTTSPLLPHTQVYIL